MIIDYLHLERIAATPHEAESVLVIDPNAMLPLAISMQPLKPVSRRGAEITYIRSSV